jgi:hypothetical protein
MERAVQLIGLFTASASERSRSRDARDEAEIRIHAVNWMRERVLLDEAATPWVLYCGRIVACRDVGGWIDGEEHSSKAKERDEEGDSIRDGRRKQRLNAWESTQAQSCHRAAKRG